MKGAVKTVVMASLLTTVPAQAAADWPFWQSYASRFLTPEGRILDPESKNRTTSEGQAYAMFFALVSNDRAKFERILRWTEDNLASGDLSRQLPAWEWGETTSGEWTVRDRNSASDADLWMAYSLLEAGSYWKERRYSTLGMRLTEMIRSREIAYLPGFGLMLLPGASGFRIGSDLYYLNASYVPAQVLLGIAAHAPGGPWREIAANVPKLVKASASDGFALDWIGYRVDKGFLAEAPGGKKTVASYDAIRVYLWAGMLDADQPARKSVCEALPGMSRILTKRGIPPSIVNADGVVEEPNGNVGFSAALVPFLEACGEQGLAAQQRERVRAARSASSGLYGDGKYYDQNLILFANGWSEGRYRFAYDGGLKLAWKVAKR